MAAEGDLLLNGIDQRNLDLGEEDFQGQARESGSRTDIDQTPKTTPAHSQDATERIEKVFPAYLVRLTHGGKIIALIPGQQCRLVLLQGGKLPFIEPDGKKIVCLLDEFFHDGYSPPAAVYLAAADSERNVFYLLFFLHVNRCVRSFRYGDGIGCFPGFLGLALRPRSADQYPDDADGNKDDDRDRQEEQDQPNGDCRQ